MNELRAIEILKIKQQEAIKNKDYDLLYAIDYALKVVEKRKDATQQNG